MDIKEANMKVFHKAKENLEKLKEIKEDLNKYNITDKGLYKYLTMSFKVFSLQQPIKEIYEVLKEITEENLSTIYTNLVEDALSKKFVFNGMQINHNMLENVDTSLPDTNSNWINETSSIIAAYLLSERILNRLIILCEQENIDEKKISDMIFTELSAIFLAY